MSTGKFREMRSLSLRQTPGIPLTTIRRNRSRRFTFDAVQIPDTHGHADDMDEVWYMLEGNGIHVVSQNVYRQVPGDAVSVAPSNPRHTLINDTEEPLKTFHFAHYTR